MQDLTMYGIDLEIAKKYADNLELHLYHVGESAKALGVSQEQLAAHDKSKWSIEEFPFYADWFYGSKSNPNGFAKALLHHYHHNPHHWQHYRLEGFSLPGVDLQNNLLQMPDSYVLEMIADWQGASVAYSGTTDLDKWLAGNWSKIELHPKSSLFCVYNLYQLGYMQDGYRTSKAMADYYSVNYDCYMEAHGKCSGEYCRCNCHE